MYFPPGTTLLLTMFIVMGVLCWHEQEGGDRPLLHHVGVGFCVN